MNVCLLISSPVRAAERRTPLPPAPTVVNALIWLSVLAGLIAFKPSKAEAVRNQTVREIPKGKPVTAARKSGKSQPARLLFTKPDPHPALDPLEIREFVTHRARPGDTLTGLLRRFGLTERERELWSRSFKKDYSINGLPPGREVHFYFTQANGRQNSADQLKALELDLDNDWTLAWEKGAKGIFFHRREKPYDIELKTVSASLENSLHEDARKAGIHSSLLSQLVDIFTWDIDLEKELRKGDSFKILYEKRSRKGQETRSSLRVLAAELISAGQKFTAVYFEKQKGQGNYYNLDGRSLARSFLRFPLEFASITSYFTDSRFHPIFKINMPHTGVDFAAPRGTPVRAVGDGTVTQAGWNGGYGKLIEIQHDSTYTTRYAHLERFAPGIHDNSPVKKGQVIGYVGTTGRTTGPHLHFELYKDQQYVDPLSVDFPAEETIDPALLKVFENQTQFFLVELSAAPQS